MKKIIVLLICICSLEAFAQEDYQLRLNDTVMNIATDKPYSILINGKQVALTLRMRDTLTYTSSFLSFKYPKAYKISSSKLEEGIDQLTILSAEGTGIIIQKYETMSPVSLEELVLTELTKESISYGFQSKRSTYKKKLASGQEITVIKAILTYKDEVNIYEVASVGKKDEGLVLVTLKMDDQKDSEGQKVIDLMWKTVRVD